MPPEGHGWSLTRTQTHWPSNDNNSDREILAETHNLQPWRQKPALPVELQGSCIPHPDHGVAPCAAEVPSAQLQRMHGAAVRVRSAAGRVWDPPLGQAAQGEDLPAAGRLQRLVAGQEGFDGSILHRSNTLGICCTHPSSAPIAFVVAGKQPWIGLAIAFHGLVVGILVA